MGDKDESKQAKSERRPSDVAADTYDVLVASSVFPDAAAIFTSRAIPLEDAKASATIVLDTNALLVPYGIGAQTLAQIEITYQQLLDSNRLVVPAQVAREFARNRATKLAEVHQKLSRRRSQLTSFQQGSYPILEHLAEYKKIGELENQLDTLTTEYRRLLACVIEHVGSSEWNDTVSALYAKLFSASVVVDTTRTVDDIKREHSRRLLHKIPPGYRDAAKDDGGIGDLLIWLTILEVGASRKTSVIFVSGEVKADWWHRSDGQPLYPRFELVDEYRRASDGHSFHIIKFSELLRLFGASKETVAEVRQEERGGSVAEVVPSPQRSEGPENTQQVRFSQLRQLLAEALSARTWVEFESAIETDLGIPNTAGRIATAPALLDGPVMVRAVDESAFELGFPIRGRVGITIVAVPYELVEAIWNGAEGRLHVLLRRDVLFRSGTSVFV